MEADTFRVAPKGSKNKERARDNKENQVKYNEPVARYGVGWLARDSVYVVG